MHGTRRMCSDNRGVRKIELRIIEVALYCWIGAWCSFTTQITHLGPQLWRGCIIQVCLRNLLLRNQDTRAWRPCMSVSAHRRYKRNQLGSATSEAAIKCCTSMADIRKVAQKSAEFKVHWKQSIQPAIDCIMERFNRLLYSGKHIHVLDDVPDDYNMRQAISSIWPDTDFSKLTAKDLADKVDLQEFFKSHCGLGQYSF